MGQSHGDLTSSNSELIQSRIMDQSHVICKQIQLTEAPITCWNIDRVIQIDCLKKTFFFAKE